MTDKLNVTADNFAFLACRTESPTTEAMKLRFAHALPTIFGMITEQIKLSNRMDMLKKHLFYGKEYEQTFERIDGFDKDILRRLTDEKMIRLLHCAIGIGTETGELFEALENHLIDGTDFDDTNFGEELGDVEWYVGIGADATKMTFSEILLAVITKLQHRYPEKFEEFKAELENRDLVGERKILETHLPTGGIVIHAENGPVGTVVHTTLEEFTKMTTGIGANAAVTVGEGGGAKSAQPLGVGGGGGGGSRSEKFTFADDDLQDSREN
jgi:NTP pyrophosphatase (non-canonical NTP hydrolase)